MTSNKGLSVQNLYKELIDLLSKDARLIIDNTLSRDLAVEFAMETDDELVNSLLASPSLKNNFFKDTGKALIFDKVKFQKFVLNKDFLPNNYTQFTNKIGLTSNDEFISSSGNVELVWPYKDCFLEGGQDIEDSKRDEIFWNESLAPDQIDRLLTPKALCKFERYDHNGKKIPVEKISIGDNLLIKGNNLLSLYTLLPNFRKKIDLIYIDPPYNPDSKNNTFTYNNDFNRSTWLTFMKNRIEVARELLTPDGSLIVAIDENEQAHLGVLLKEMFPGHECHCITIVHNPRGIQGTNFSYTHEYAFFIIPKGKKIIGHRPISDSEISWRNLRDNGGESLRTDAKTCFYPIIVENGEVVGFGEVTDHLVHPKHNVKKGTKTYVYPVDPKNIERKWRYSQESVKTIQHLLRAKESKRGIEIEIGKDFGTYRTVWQDSRYDANEYGTKLLKDLVPNSDFLFPKSLWNTHDCVYAVVGNNKNAIILDFFAGSGTTAHAVLEMNKNDGGTRQFIMCEQMYYVDTVTKERLRQVVKRNKQGNFVYAELAKANEEFIDKIQSYNSKKDLINVWNEMQEKAFLSFRLSDKMEKIRFEEIENSDIALIKTFLLEVLDKNFLYVPFSEIDDKSYGFEKDEITINKNFMTLDDND